MCIPDCDINVRITRRKFKRKESGYFNNRVCMMSNDDQADKAASKGQKSAGTSPRIVHNSRQRQLAYHRSGTLLHKFVIPLKQSGVLDYGAN
jgi:hypothetical protein